MSEPSRYQDVPVGPYRLTKLLGVGPVSRVYLAERQDWPGRAVALKLFESVPLPTLEEKDQTLDEIRMLVCIEHPAILPTLDDGLFENILYLVTPYIDGETLRQRLTRTMGEPLPVADALLIVRQIGEALHFAHTQGIVHANLKPENIFFQSDGRPLLADFLLPSLARSERAARILSSFAALYMAPEQFRGTATPLSDQYALACLTYELLTGQPPFEAEDGMSLARQHATKEPKLPSLLQPACEPHIDQALLKALVKRPEGRHPDVQAFLAELHAPALPVPLVTASVELPVAIPPSSEPAESVLAAEAPVPGITELETIKQPALKLVSAAVLTGVHEAVTFVTRAGKAKAPTGASQQFKTFPTFAQPAPVPARASTGSRLSRRQVWLTASLVILVLLVSIAGLTIFFNAVLAHQTPSQARASVGITATSTTLATNNLSPVISTPAGGSTATVTATPTPVKSKPTPTATPTTKPKPTATPTATPTAQPLALSCKVTYHVSDQWNGGFLASLTITNTGATTVQGWKLIFTFPDNQQIFSGWNGKFSQSGAQVTITNSDFNGTLQPGSSTRPGFQGAFHIQNDAPTSFTLNGVACH